MLLNFVHRVNLVHPIYMYVVLPRLAPSDARACRVPGGLQFDWLLAPK